MIMTVGAGPRIDMFCFAAPAWVELSVETMLVVFARHCTGSLTTVLVSYLNIDTDIFE
jgi:hypothetical protein